LPTTRHRCNLDCVGLGAKPRRCDFDFFESEQCTFKGQAFVYDGCFLWIRNRVVSLLRYTKSCFILDVLKN